MAKKYINPNNVTVKSLLSYDIPEFCPCAQMYNDKKSLMIANEGLFRQDGDKKIMVLDSGTTFVRWKPKMMKKYLTEQLRKLEKRCNAQ